MLWQFLKTTLLVAAVGAHASLGEASSVGDRLPFKSVSGNVTLEQLDTIMSLVSIAENSKVEWWTNYDYCEDIGDGRGYTMSLVGFCSGTSDLLGVVRDVAKAKASHRIAQFVKPLQAVDGTPSHKGLGSLCSTIHSNNDATWKAAVWGGIRREYWDPATNWAAKHGLTSALSKGFLFDVALNHGAEVVD
ncbi:hypothetical protein Poli38472_001580 [Pythium oligandrum]|uniref:Chitosanase n=1 Tax=Pythium oligandrum TaxID=41045 RepID=A0A8K1CUE2_PYTOL|nr:hypothetical protein Poli38472_001580 [Pythium oligandrum]|eukprot:TMW69424.1 hypothetical protein Poli38472_001580 [Pythium oligandrum]